MSERIVLVKGPGKAYSELGTLQGEPGKVLTVRRADGSISEVPRAGHMMVNRGGINHILRVYVDQMARIFEEHPREVADQLLREAADPLPSAIIRKKLQALPVPSETVDRMWSQVKSHLDKSSAVKVSAEKPRRYSWKGSEAPDGLLPLVDREHGEPSAGTIKRTDAETAAQQKSPTTAAGVEPQAESMVPIPGPEPKEESPVPTPRAEPEGPDPSAQESTEELQPALGTAEGSLVAALRNVGGPADVRSTRQVATRLLECATAIKGSSAEELKALLAVEEPELPVAHALVACLPKRLWTLAGNSNLFDDDSAAHFAQLVVGEITRSDDSDRKALSPAAVNFFGQLLNAPSAARLPSALLARLVVVLTNLVHGAPVRLSDHAAGLLASALPVAPEDDLTAALTDGMPSLARSLQSLPLEARSGRALFLASLFRLRPEIARREEWWRGPDFATLSASARGPLSAALNDEVIGRQYVRPIVLSFTDALSTRRGLADLTGAAPELLRHLPSANYREAWRRVSGEDPMVLGWFSELASTRRLQTARESLAVAQRELELARAEKESSERRASQLEVEIERATIQLTQMRQEVHASSEAHDRQVKLDVITALANLALTVLQTPAARSDQALMQTVDYITEREGLEQTETWGSEVPYRPERHDSLGAPIDPGTTVLVLRPGYTYNVGGESVVLIKAHVGRK